MMDNVRSAMARMATIRSTMAPTAPTATPVARSVSPETIQASFGQLMAQAASNPGLFGQGSPMTLGQFAGFGQQTPEIHAHSHGGGHTTAPRGLEGFRNGHIPADRLAAVPGTTERLWAPAGAAYSAMRRDAAEAGISLHLVDGYRPYEDQVRLARELGLYSEGGLAAEPGTSQHGWGRAVDLELDDRGIAWMRDNAWKYGFRETVPREPWHWEFHPTA